MDAALSYKTPVVLCYSFFFDSLFSISVYVKNNMAVLIDGGISKDLAKDPKKPMI